MIFLYFVLKNFNVKYVIFKDEENSSSLLSELSALEQQVMMEKRQKKKSENFYFKLTESSKSEKGTKF